MSNGIILLGTDGWYAQIWSWLYVTRRQCSVMAEWLFLHRGSANNFVLRSSSLVWIRTNRVLNKSEASPVAVVSPWWGCAGSGGGEPLFIVDVCMCVSSSDAPSLISFSPSCVSSPPPLVCVSPALFLPLGTEAQKLLHYIDGESSPTLLTNAQCSYRILWSCILPEQEAVLFMAWFCCGSMLLTHVRKTTCKSEWWIRKEGGCVRIGWFILFSYMLSVPTLFYFSCWTVHLRLIGLRPHFPHSFLLKRILTIV